uniref:Uncharacterized protein n=1 Tax=Oryza glumipatula TaxID=40148 RepID=A0A0D9ZBM2_9ORYZ
MGTTIIGRIYAGQPSVVEKQQRTTSSRLGIGSARARGGLNGAVSIWLRRGRGGDAVSTGEGGGVVDTGEQGRRGDCDDGEAVRHGGERDRSAGEDGSDGEEGGKGERTDRGCGRLRGLRRRGSEG